LRLDKTRAEPLSWFEKIDPYRREAHAMTTQDPSPERPSKEECKRAMKAFKKRLKLMRLDDESRVGRGATSSGSQSGIVGIKPPEKYPKAVWDELVRQGKLRQLENGLYERVVPPEN
jgi:hypothetical protein